MTRRRTMNNTSSRSMGEESDEGNDGGNSELHDFDFWWLRFVDLRRLERISGFKRAPARP